MPVESNDVPWYDRKSRRKPEMPVESNDVPWYDRKIQAEIRNARRECRNWISNIIGLSWKEIWKDRDQSPQEVNSVNKKEKRVCMPNYKKTKIACYLGFIVFSVILFVMVVTGATALPSWACIFNILLIASVLFPLRIGGAGNWAGAAMFLGLLLLI